MRVVASILLCCVLSMGVAVAETIPEYLQDISVTISAGGDQGSGVIFRRADKTFVWTAAHVVDRLRTTRYATDPKTGTERKIIEFDDAKIVKHIIEDGRTVGRTEWNAVVVRYSDFETGEDLALLRLRSKNFLGRRKTARFYLDQDAPGIGSKLWHCGSLLGELGSNSITDGVLSQYGRLIGQTVYDQTTAVAFPGSSGGGVYLTDGRYIGMVVRGAGEGFNLIVPVRRIVRWAKSADVYWAVDPTVEMPSDEDMKKIPVEDIGISFSGR